MPDPLVQLGAVHYIGIVLHCEIGRHIYQTLFLNRFFCCRRQERHIPSNSTGKIFSWDCFLCHRISVFFDVIVDAFFEGLEIALVDGFDIGGICILPLLLYFYPHRLVPKYCL